MDACRGGWVGVALLDGGFERAAVFKRFIEVLDWAGRAEAIGVDIPLGVDDTFPRAADVHARRFVAPLASTVFLTPPRSVLEAPSHAEANGRMRELANQGVSRQAYGLSRRILEAERWAGANPHVVEVHPEVTFRELAGTRITHSKHSWAGFFLRRNLLSSAGITIPEGLERLPLVDVLDAAAAAWSADRYARGQAQPIPSGHDARLGAIWR